MDFLFQSTLQTPATHIEKNFNESGGLLHKKLVDRYKVVSVLPKTAESFVEIFQYADAYGQVRLGILHKIVTNDKDAVAVGGKIGIKSASWYGLGFNVAAYISQDTGIIEKERKSYDFFDVNGASYVYLGEASIDYQGKRVEAKIGRFGVDMPFANTDDIRMHPNSFEGAWGNYKFHSAFSSQLFFISRWAGYDSQDIANAQSQNEFKKLVENGFGMVGASISYRYDENNELSLWQHYIDNLSSIFYCEFNGVWYHDETLHMNYAFQYAHLQELQNSAVAGDVVGITAMLHKGGLFFPFAYNAVFLEDDDIITDGYGGGPYFTSLDEATIAAASEYMRGENIHAYKIGSGYEWDEYVLEYAYGYMHGRKKYLREHNFIVSYDLNSQLIAQTVYANYKTMDERMERFLVRLEYNF